MNQSTEIHYCSCGCGLRLFKAYNTSIWPKYVLGHDPKFKEKKKSHKQKSLKTTKKANNKGLVSKSPKLRAMENADMWFSRYIRFKHSEEKMFGIFICWCYTCGNLHDIKHIDNGHYHNREHKATRYHENNCRPQCVHCNQFRSGKHTIFGDKLLKEIGPIEFENLRLLALSVGEDNEIFYREQAKIYRLKFNQLVKEKGSNPWKN